MPVAGVLGLCLWISSDRVPADPARALRIQGARLESLDGPTFRVATFNIHGAKGRDQRRDLGRIAGCLADVDVDVAGLHEVHGSPWGAARSQVAALGGLLEMGWAFAPAEHRYWWDSFGNGVLSRVQMVCLQTIPLPGTQGYRFRNVVFLKFRHRGHVVHLLTTHTDTREDRDAQLRIVSELFLSLEEPAILMGDLNALASDPILRRLLEAPGVSPVRPQNPSAAEPPFGVDWILLRGLVCVRSEWVPTEASDHWPLWADLALP